MKTYDRRLLESNTHLLRWIRSAPGAFNVWDLAPTFEEREILVEDCELLVIQGVLKHHGKRRGWYIKVDDDLEEMDFINVDPEPVDIWLPFGASDLVEIYPGNLIIVAGAKSSGKTALMLNMIRENRHRFECHYFNSEMGPEELRKRLDLVDYISIDQWDFRAWKRAENFGDVVKPGKNCLNIIDFLEIHDEFYAVGRALKEIHDNLKGAIAVVCIQKNPGVDVGLGGWRSMEVTRFALSLERGKVKIIEAKNFKDPTRNPNGKIKTFKMLDGWKIIKESNWFGEGES
jgi:hypothetical protein